jgi:hypothetical protein
VWVSAKFGTGIVVSVNRTLVEDNIRWFKGECAHFSFNKCPIHTLDGARAKFSTNSRETDNSVDRPVTHSYIKNKKKKIKIDKERQVAINRFIIIMFCCVTLPLKSMSLCHIFHPLLFLIFNHRKIRLIESNAKCRHLQKSTFKGTLRQVFICLRNTCPPYIPYTCI